jgi:hypothetical protein
MAGLVKANHYAPSVLNDDTLRWSESVLNGLARFRPQVMMLYVNLLNVV